MNGQAGPETTTMLPAIAGIGLRLTHMPAFANAHPDAAPIVPWVEIHSENFLCAGGARPAMLDAVAARYPLSCHGVGLSLGSAEGLDSDHLARLSALYARVKPIQISEHLSWSIVGGDYLNDLLPLPYTVETLDIVCRNIDRAQSSFGRTILVENPSAYLAFAETCMSETDFLNALAARTGCGLLVDINNVYVTATNTTSGDVLQTACAYIDAIAADAVGEIHLAGHSISGEGADRILIDTHSTMVCDDVWALYRHAVNRFGARPTLIEWDIDVPELPVLLEEAARAQTILAIHQESRRHVA